MTRPTTGTDQELRQIGEVAERVGLSLRTIRYYEEVGLAPPSGRSDGGFRLYTDDDVERLRLVKSFKPLKFTLEEMRDLLALRDRFAVGESLSPVETGRLRVYADAAAHRSERLREQLDDVESLARVLAREAARAGRRSGLRRATEPQRRSSV